MTDYKQLIIDYVTATRKQWVFDEENEKIEEIEGACERLFELMCEIADGRNDVR